MQPEAVFDDNEADIDQSARPEAPDVKRRRVRGKASETVRRSLGCSPARTDHVYNKLLWLDLF